MLRGNGVIGLRKSFILGSSSHLDNFSQLESFGLSDVNILTIGAIVNGIVGEESSTLMVVESVKTVNYHFMRVFEDFLKSLEYDACGLQTRNADNRFKAMVAWWEHIEADFFKIFRSVMKGLFFLYSKGFPCGNLCADHIYVTEETEGRIVPCFEISKSFKDDLKELEKTMKNIIYQPHEFINVSNENRPEYIPFELAHLLNFLNNLRRFRFPCNVVDHPYFWTSAERVSFIRKIRNLSREGVITANMFAPSFNAMMIKKFGDDYTIWYHYLTNGLLKAIRSKGGSGGGGGANESEYVEDANEVEAGHVAKQAGHVAPYVTDFVIIHISTPLSLMPMTLSMKDTDERSTLPKLKLKRT